MSIWGFSKQICGRAILTDRAYITSLHMGVDALLDYRLARARSKRRIEPKNNLIVFDTLFLSIGSKERRGRTKAGFPALARLKCRNEPDMDNRTGLHCFPKHWLVKLTRTRTGS